MGPKDKQPAAFAGGKHSEYSGNRKGSIAKTALVNNGQKAARGPTGGAKVPAKTGARPAKHGPTGGAKMPPSAKKSK